jgi:hypothetical protein
MCCSSDKVGHVLVPLLASFIRTLLLLGVPPGCLASGHSKVQSMSTPSAPACCFSNASSPTCGGFSPGGYRSSMYGRWRRRGAPSAGSSPTRSQNCVWRRILRIYGASPSLCCGWLSWSRPRPVAVTTATIEDSPGSRWRCWSKLAAKS